MALVRENGAPAPYQQIRDILRKEITEGLSPGDRIEAERALAVRFGANRATISRAIASLVNEGFLVRRVGRGTFVSNVAANRDRVRTKAVGLVVSNISADFPSGLAKAAVRGLRDEAYRAVLFDSEGSATIEAEELERLMNELLDGGLIMPVELPNNAQLLDRVNRLGPPVVFLDRTPVGMEADCVCTDNYWGSYQAVSNLVRRGHTRIAHFTWLSGCESSAIQERRQGYEDALRDHGIAVDPELICPPAVLPDGHIFYKHAVFYLRQAPRPITAILGLNDAFTVGAIEGCQALGLSVPNDVEVAGFYEGRQPFVQDIRFMRIVQDQEEIGRQAVNLLLSRIAGNGPEGPQRITIRPEIIDIV